MMQPDPNVRCPATGFTKTCRSILAEYVCPKFVTIQGDNPQTGEKVNQSGCVDGFLPMLLIENANMSRQAGAAVESFRNEVVAGEKRRMDALSKAFPSLPGNH